MDIIKFSKNYNKLHGQITAELLAVKTVNLSLMRDDDFKDLVEYDCKAEDGSYYPLDKNKSYSLLVFIGNKNIVFQTLRSKEKKSYYMDKIGNKFEVVLIDV